MWIKCIAQGHNTLCSLGSNPLTSWTLILNPTLNHCTTALMSALLFKNGSTLSVNMILIFSLAWNIPCFSCVTHKVFSGDFYTLQRQKIPHELHPPLSNNNMLAYYGIYSGYLLFCCNYCKCFHRVYWKHQYFYKCDARMKIWMFSLQEMNILW